MNRPALRKFIKDFKYFMSDELYIKYEFVCRHYEKLYLNADVIKNYKNLSEKIQENPNHYKKYKSLLKKLENSIYVELQTTNEETFQKIFDELEVEFQDNQDMLTQLHTFTPPSQKRKLKRVIQNFKSGQSTSDFIKAKNLCKIMLDAIPAPTAVGYKNPVWTLDNFNEYVNHYFVRRTNIIKPQHFNKYHSKNFSDFKSQLNFYAHKTCFEFYYLSFTEINYKDGKKSCISALLPLDDEVKKMNKINSTLFESEKKLVCLQYFFEQAFKKVQQEPYNIPVFVFNKDSISNNILEDFYKENNLISHYRLLPFTNKDIEGLNASTLSDKEEILYSTLNQIRAWERELSEKLNSLNLDQKDYNPDEYQEVRKLITNFWNGSH